MESTPTPVAAKAPKAKEGNVSTFVLKPKRFCIAYIYFSTATVAKLREEKKMD
jgi:hypothetical protein